MSHLAKAWSELRGYAAAVFFVCLLGWSLTMMDQSLFSYAMIGIQEEFNVGIKTIGWILTISFIFTAIVAVVIGVLTDHYGRKVMFLFCLAVSALFVGLHAFIAGIASLTILRMLAMGLSNGLAPITNTYAAEAAPARYRGLMVGLLQTGFPIGWFLASLIAVPIIGTLGWRYVFLPALAVIPIAFLLVRRLPESKKFTDAQEQAAKKVVVAKGMPNFSKVGELFEPALRKRTLLIFLAFVMFGGAYAGTAFYFPIYFVEVRGYTEEVAATIIGVSYLIGVIGYIFAAFIGEFILTRRNTIIIWSWLGGLSLAGLMWLSPGYISDYIWFSVMASFFYGTAAVLMTYVTEVFPTRVRATGAGFAGTFAFNIGQAIFPLMVAYGIDVVGWQWAFTIAAVPSMIIVGLALANLENIKSGLELDEIAT